MRHGSLVLLATKVLKSPLDSWHLGDGHHQGSASETESLASSTWQVR